MDSKSKVLILGHSFVRRFQFFLYEGLDSRTFPGLDLSSVEIHFLGIGGRTVAKILAFDLDHVRALQPDIVVLEIGSNDLCEAGHRPETVGSSIESLVCKLHEECNVAFIVLYQVIHRATLPSHCPRYNSSVDTLNKYLDVVLEPLSFAEFWRHKGLREPKITVLRRDGIHLNDQGNYVLYRSYRGAILFALQRITLGKALPK